MARPLDPTAPYWISIHNIGGYRYASTQPAYQDPVTGKTKHKRIHWGTLDDSNKFIPGSKYIFAPIEERSKLIFPEDRFTFISIIVSVRSPDSSVPASRMVQLSSRCAPRFSFPFGGFAIKWRIRMVRSSKIISVRINFRKKPRIRCFFFGFCGS